MTEFCPVYPAVHQVKHAGEPVDSSYFVCEQERCRAERMKAASSVTGRFDRHARVHPLASS